MSDPLPPRHVGRRTEIETGYALVCNATPSGDPKTSPLCGKRATYHIRWNEETTYNSLSCDEDIMLAMSFAPFDVHSTEDSACAMPGSLWVLRNGDAPSYCVLQVEQDDRNEAGGSVQPYFSNLVGSGYDPRSSVVEELNRLCHHS